MNIYTDLWRVTIAKQRRRVTTATSAMADPDKWRSREDYRLPITYTYK